VMSCLVFDWFCSLFDQERGLYWKWGEKPTGLWHMGTEKSLLQHSYRRSCLHGGLKMGWMGSNVVIGLDIPKICMALFGVLDCWLGLGP
jgi:hypothetical protein